MQSKITFNNNNLQHKCSYYLVALKKLIEFRGIFYKH